MNFSKRVDITGVDEEDIIDAFICSISEQVSKVLRAPCHPLFIFTLYCSRNYTLSFLLTGLK